MAKQWITHCKECNEPFKYSDNSYHQQSIYGLSRPERCPNCQKKHNRRKGGMGLAYYDLAPQPGTDLTRVTTGELGAIPKGPRIHEDDSQPSLFDPSKYGIKDDDILEIFEWLMDPSHRVAVVVGDTGTGKSTVLPYRLIDPPPGIPKDQFTRYGQVVVTQPRIQATRNIPAYVGKQLYGADLGAGMDIGFRYSENPYSDRRNRLIYCTDGTLLQWIVSGEIANFSVIMIDEAHERTLNVDLILALLKKVLPRHPHLKIIIASATIEAGVFVNYFGDTAHLINIRGKHIYQYYREFAFPPDTRLPYDYPDIRLPYEDQDTRRLVRELPEAITQKASSILFRMRTKPNVVQGDILVFLHGEQIIRATIKLLNQTVIPNPGLYGQVKIYPLYAMLSDEQQRKALEPDPDPNVRRVVLTTNIAETSLTVEGISYVIDSGVINLRQWNEQTQTEQLVPSIHSQAGCKQRWGRVGRTSPGEVYCLYTQDQFNRFEEYSTSEVERASLEQLLLTAMAAGIDDIESIEWITKPDQKQLELARKNLQLMQAFDKTANRGAIAITGHGLAIQTFAKHLPIYANLLTLADRFSCLTEVATLVPFFENNQRYILIWDTNWSARKRWVVSRLHKAMKVGCRDDVEFCLKLYACWSNAPAEEQQSWARNNYINHSLLCNKIYLPREEILKALSANKKEDERRPIDFSLMDKVRKVLMLCLDNRICTRSSKVDNEGEEDEISYKLFRKLDSEEGNSNLQEVLVRPDYSSTLNGHLPDTFLFCGRPTFLSKQKGASPDIGLPTLVASYVCQLDQEWLTWFQQPSQSWLAFSQWLALYRQTSMEPSPAGFSDWMRLLLDQVYPLGSQYKCQINQFEFGHELHVGVIEKTSDCPSYVDESEATDENPNLESEEALGKLADTVLDIKKDQLFQDPEFDATPAWVDLTADNWQMEQNFQTPLQEKYSTLPASSYISMMDLKKMQVDFRLRLLSSSTQPRGIFTAEVVDYNLETTPPQVILKPVKPGERLLFSPYEMTITVDAQRLERIRKHESGRLYEIEGRTGAILDFIGNGKVTILANDKQEAEVAQKAVEQLFSIPQIGEVYTRKITKIHSQHGVFINLFPGLDGLIPRSKEYLDDVASEGDEITVKVTDIFKNERGEIRIELASQGIQTSMRPLESRRYGRLSGLLDRERRSNTQRDRSDRDDRRPTTRRR